MAVWKAISKVIDQSILRLQKWKSRSQPPLCFLRSCMRSFLASCVRRLARALDSTIWLAQDHLCVQRFRAPLSPALS